MSQNTMPVRFELTGLKEFEAFLEGLKRTIRNKIIRSVLTKAAQILKREAQARAPILKNRKKYKHLKPGLLKQSIGVLTKTYSSGTVVVMIGPRRKFRSIRLSSGKFLRQSKKNAAEFGKAAQQAGKGRVQNPSMYAHLVEYGYTLPSGRHVAGRSFIRVSLDVKRALVVQTIKNLMKQEIEAAIQKRAA